MTGERDAIERVVRRLEELHLASAEDTVLAKLEWARMAGGSERQMQDVAGILDVSGPRLDRAYIKRWAAVLGVLDLWGEVERGR